MFKAKAIVFGVGGLYLNLKDAIFSHYDVLALYDNDVTKRGKYLDGQFIHHIDDGFPDDYELILVVSMYFADIRVQLLEAGVCDAKIKNINFDRLIGRDLLAVRKKFKKK